MKIEEQVLSIEQMQHLKELGVEVKDNAIVRYRRRTDISGNRVIGKWHIVPLSEIPLLRGFEKFEIHNTLTLQEILERLPKVIDAEYYLVLSHNNIEYSSLNNGIKISFDWTFFNGDAPYKMLCWVAENGYLNK